MNPEAIWAVGDLLEMVLTPFDWIGNTFNDVVLLGGFVGMFIWLRMQGKLTKKAKDEGTLV